MADQASTPNSAADSSVAGSSKPPNTTNPSGSGSASATGGSSAPKDKACPFCGQPFTSSSLGRHLDLYIKEKNPKPADGLHDVDEIRKMRGAITRRQPRGSSGRREESTPAGTPRGTPALRSGQGESDMGTPTRSNSGGGTRAGMVQRQPMMQEKGKVTTALNQVNWQSTGVINNIPIMHQRNDLNGGSNMATGVADVMAEGRRTVSRQIAAKNTFEQKQKMLDAMEGQRAAELALREILGSIKAAITVAQPSLTASPFDFDPLTLSFPSLVLTCLPPPPTISQISPVAHPNSWFTDPPSQVQFKALTAHFRDRFHNVNIMRTLVASTPPHPDDILYAHHAAPEVQAAISQQAKQYEEQVTSHLHQAFQHWMQTQPAQREELWKLELARAVGLKSQRVSSLEQELESVQQENAHLKYQVESLSRLQNPKEFALSAPQTLSLNRREAVKLAELGMRGRSTGFRIGDSEESLQNRVEQAVERWRPVVRRSRAGMQNQRSLSGQMRPGQSMSDIQNGMGGQSQQMNSMPSEMELDAEADMDADAEAEEENYNQAQAQAQMQQQQQQRSETSTPITQQHMIQAGYPNIQAQQQNLRGQQNQQQQQMNVGNVNGMAMMNLQQQHAAAQQAAQQQAQMGGQQQQQQMNQGQQGDNSNSMANGQHQGMAQAQQQQMAAIRRQQQQSGVAAQMNGGRAGGRINVPF